MMSLWWRPRGTLVRNNLRYLWCHEKKKSHGVMYWTLLDGLWPSLCWKISSEEELIFICVHYLRAAIGRSRHGNRWNFAGIMSAGGELYCYDHDWCDSPLDSRSDWKKVQSGVTVSRLVFWNLSSTTRPYEYRNDGSRCLMSGHHEDIRQ